MADRIKDRLDADWHDFLDELNRTYEAAYESTMKRAWLRDRVRRVHLVLLEWTEDEDLRIGLGVELEADGADHEH